MIYYSYIYSNHLVEQLSSISHSPKGWTDQELGSQWLEQDFEPATAARNTSNGYCLLVLDGHNSHCTYRFCNFAAKHRIIIICLPSHTTHVLQPCDVGVFGPLSKLWKAQVNKASRANILINKTNLLFYYHDRGTERRIQAVHDSVSIPQDWDSPFQSRHHRSGSFQTSKEHHDEVKPTPSSPAASLPPSAFGNFNFNNPAQQYPPRCATFSLAFHPCYHRVLHNKHS